MLQAEIDSLKEENYDYTLTGFTDESLAEAVDATYQALTSEEEAPPSSTQEIDPDQYQLGHHCPRCGFEFNDDQQT